MSSKFRFVCMAVIVLMVLGVSTPSRAGDLVGSVAAPRPEHVVVFVETAAGNFPAGRMQLDQQKKTFSAYVSPVLKGSTVAFHNSDNLAHNVFGIGADEFNLGTFGKDNVREHKFDKAGEVTLLCNIHPEMEAHVLVLQNPYFARLDPSGKFRISGVPAGSYVVKAWYEGKIKKQNVNVPAAGDVTLSF